MKFKIALVIFVATIFVTRGAKAQVKLGTLGGAPNSGAILDASNTAATATTYKGIYLPQVALTANNVYGLNMGATAGSVVPVNGMMIYNMAVAGTGPTAVTPGIYIWNNNVWNQVNTSSIATNNKNIYEGDGILTGNRNVNLATANLLFTGGKVGIGTTTPTNQLQVVAVKDPVRFNGLQSGDATVTGTLVTDTAGVIKIKSRNTMSAVSVTGNMTFAADSTDYYTDVSNAPVEAYDNQNEFNGNTFTAGHDGLYQVTFTMNFNQRPNTATSTNDNGDGYMGIVSINVGTVVPAPNYSLSYGKIMVPESLGGAGLNQSVINTDLVKLTAGQVIQFQSRVYGSTGGVSASYIISIVRVD